MQFAKGAPNACLAQSCWLSNLRNSDFGLSYMQGSAFKEQGCQATPGSSLWLLLAPVRFMAIPSESWQLSEVCGGPEVKF